jgi:hypothetical protein
MSYIETAVKKVKAYMASFNFQVGACYGIEYLGASGSIRIFNGKVVTETVSTITIKYMGSNAKISQSKLSKNLILKVVKL